jgi:ADP-heptose:LPS heptosyltransferase
MRSVTDPGPPEVLIHPGSGSPLKNWPADRFRALVDRLVARSWSVKIIVGPADGTAAKTLHGAAPGVHPPTLLDLTSALERCALYVGNDSGVTHLSARLGVPTVAVFGPTDPRRWAPRGSRVRVVGHPSWPSVDEVWTAVQAVWN